MEVCTCTITMKISVMVPLEARNRSTPRNSYTTFGNKPKGLYILLQRHLLSCVHCCSIHNQKLEAMSVNGWVYEEIMYIYTMGNHSTVKIKSWLGFWSIQTLVPDPSGSVRRRLPLVASVSSWTSHWLATPTSSMPPLPKHIFQGGQVIGWRFGGWVGMPSTGSLTWPWKMAISSSISNAY